MMKLFSFRSNNIVSVLLLCNCVLFIHASVNAQEKNIYNERFLDGTYYLLDENYTGALRSFLVAYNIDSSNANINFNVGFSYLNSISEKAKAIPYLKKAILDASEKYIPFDPKEKNAPVNSYYYLGIAFRLGYSFDDAIRSFDRFKTYLNSNEKDLIVEVDRQIEMCRNAKEIYAQPSDVKISILKDSVNSPYPDYSPVLSADESTLIFTSRRPEGTGYDLTPTGDYYEDIYISHKKDGKWSKPLSISPDINTQGHEAAIGLSANGEQLLIYRDDGGDGNIYISKLEGDKWTAPEKLGSNVNSSAWEPSACFSADGNTIYFVSDRKGGYGGRDIYKCVKLPNGEWSLASNLGSAINTPYDEDAPFMHPDGVTLIFSSDGHKTTGGFDIFYSTREDDGRWAVPKNMGAPTNTPDDDVFYVLSADGTRAYYSSTKEDGYGEKDLYLITLVKTVVDPVTLLKGFVTFDGVNRLSEDIKITVTDNETGFIIQEIRPNSKTGKYIIALPGGPGGKKYTIKYNSKEYGDLEEIITIEPGSSYQEILKEVDLKPVNLESKVPGTLSVAGKVTNKTGEIIPNVLITVTNNKTGKLVSNYFAKPATGKYYFVLQGGENYSISYEADGYLFQTENVNIPRQPEYTQIEKDIVLEPVIAGTKIVLNNIFFDFNKSSLSNESTVELEKLYTFMKENKSIKVEISGHTDNKGRDATNMKLSQARAKAVVDYMIKKGIEKARLLAKGYGETMPVAPNLLPNGEPDEKGMQMNRRVELKIIN